MSDEARRKPIEVTVSIDAPLAVLLRALTDAEDLTRWFPTEAGAVPGEGGEIGVSWGEGSFERVASIRAC